MTAGVPHLNHLEHNRAVIAWSEQGTGPAVIWAHGLLANNSSLERMGIFNWTPVAQSGRRLIRYDARGHGQSSAEPKAEDFTYASLADDLLAIAAAVQPGSPVDAIGSSMGTATILHAAVKAPARFRRLVLAIPGTAWESRQAQGALYTQAADRIEREGEPAIQQLVARITRPAIFDSIPRLPIEVGLPLLPAVLRGVGRSDLPSPDELRQLSMPALVLAWKGDSTHPVATSERLAAILPNVELRIADSLSNIQTWGRVAADFLAG